MDTNLAELLRGRLPPDLLELVLKAAAAAATRGDRLFLAGGIVRDLLLGRTGYDIDLAVEGDGILLARNLAEAENTTVTVHPSFGTAKICWGRYSLDFASTRQESYPRPAALPIVKPGNLGEDLLRRDFTINAMAVSLNRTDFGALIDTCGGRRDLEWKLVRVLHEKSFQDDPTRIWRALRYEQRLNFTLEPHTLNWLERDIAGLDIISGERLRYELECVFSEEFPENILARAGELGVLAHLHPALRADTWLAEKYVTARQNDSTDTPLDTLYMCLLFYRLDDTDAAALTQKLNLTRAAASVLHDMRILKNRLDGLSLPGRKPSEVHAMLAGLAPAVLRAAAIAGKYPTASRNIEFYLDKLRHVKPRVSGRDILKTGIPPGPLVGDMLRQRLAEQLDAEFTPLS
jgi:tRNA nucleotidyltransferase (CCA-adding enzyme)